MARRLLSIGECMVELMQADGGLMRKSFAGDTFNTAYYARLFLPTDWSVDYFSAVGTDTISYEMLAFMEGHGIGTGDIARIEGRAPGLYMIHLNNGERNFSYWRSVSAAKLLARDPHRLRHAIEAADVVVFSGITLAILPFEDVDTLLAELRRAKASGKLVAFDPNIRPRLWDSAERMRATISDGARAATLVMPSFDDEAAHFGDASITETITRYRALGVADVVVKDGANGATLAFGEAKFNVPSATVEQIIDTTSAGDSFNGGFLARYVLTADAASSASFAAELAASVIQHHGALVPRDKLPA
ncbi:2-dehydro-3-deoxygluconokinase [Mycoplana sp. BE70]|uniref:sugar kinase n=1 Tax=Mycoplana sp. BE70 TaxID=2817775 RepID=UPI00286133D4|nr:sugar kinase [Mycoplana sp. BE70]MDR6757660.1 2-dehydro-3-deoxygluconokinase [Mycoplana sp. BE70]